MRLYLDLCCFNRPFDDQSQLLVRLQTEAKLAIQESIRNRTYCLIWSAILDLENGFNPDLERKEAIAQWKNLAELDTPIDDSIERLAGNLCSDGGLKPMDALPMAAAITSGADCFLTTDKGILRKMQGASLIRVLDPVDFYRETEAIDE